MIRLPPCSRVEEFVASLTEFVKGYESKARLQSAQIGSYAGARPWEDGDDASRIDWRVTAMLGGLSKPDPEVYVAEYDRPRRAAVQLLIDCGRNMAIGYYSDIKYLKAIRASVAFAILACMLGDSPSAVALTDKPQHLSLKSVYPEDRRPSALAYRLCMLRPDAGKPLLDRVLAAVTLIVREKGLSILITDYSAETLLEAVRVLQASASSCYVLIVRSEGELLSRSWMVAARDVSGEAGEVGPETTRLISERIGMVRRELLRMQVPHSEFQRISDIHPAFQHYITVRWHVGGWR